MRRSLTRKRPPPSRTARFRGAASRVCHFDVPSAGLTDAFFDAGDNEIVKEALLFVEGDHTDSAKRPHRFPAERVFKVVENTNKFLRSGGRVPWQQDHNKAQVANIGDLDGEIELRTITADDLPNPRAKHLIGKVGAFGRLIGRGKAIADIVAGNIKTLSPGIDIASDIIREISATPTPAIVGLSTFKQGDDKPATNWEEAENKGKLAEAEREEYEELCDRFWQIATNIRHSDPDALGDDPYNAMQVAIDGFVERLQLLISPEGTEPAGTPQQPAQTQSGRYPNMVQKTQQNPQARQAAQAQKPANMSAASGWQTRHERRQHFANANRSKTKEMALFTMSDMAAEIAEYGYDGSTAEFRRGRRLKAATKRKISQALKGKRRRGRKGSKVKKAAKAAALTGVLAAGGIGALRYGRTAIGAAKAARAGGLGVSRAQAAGVGAGTAVDRLTGDVGRARGAVASGVGRARGAATSRMNRARSAAADRIKPN